MSDYLVLETAGGAIYAPNWEAVGKLAAKMAALMGAVGQIKKDAKNTFHKYDYTSYEALAAHVRTAVVKVGLAFTVSATDMREEPGDKMQTRLMGLELTFTDTETGAMRVMRGYGEGADNQDKGTAKALTSGVKYMLMRNLLVSEDADVDSDADAPAQRAQTARTAPAAQPEPEDNAGPEPGIVIPPRKEPHWFDEPGAQPKFWAFASGNKAGQLGLSQADVHAALSVEHIRDFTGSKADAVALLKQYKAEMEG